MDRTCRVPGGRLPILCRALRRCVVLGWWVVAAANACAQLPLARLTSVFPAGASLGSTQQVVLQGADLEELTALWFSEPRITAVKSAANPLAWDVGVPEEIAPGCFDLRAISRFGVSNPRVFAVGRAQERTLNATNLSVADALELPVDQVVNGRVPASAALWFRLSLAAGQRVVIRVAARELDSRLDPVVTLLDAAQREVDRARRGWLSFEAPTTGAWWIRLHDITFRGGDEHVFRLTASTAPEVEWAWPQSVRPGVTERVTLFGRQLPGARITAWRGADGRPLEAIDLDVTIPADAPRATRPPGTRLASARIPGWWWTTPESLGLPAPLFFAEAEETGRLLAPWETPVLSEVTPPCEYWGRFAARGTVAGVRFTARKGEVWWLEVQSERLGWGADAALVIQREVAGVQGAEATWVDVVDFQDQDTNFGTPGFSTQTRDPAGRFESPEDGSYRVVVRDLFRLAPEQARLPYRLLIRRESPAFALVAHPQMPPSPDPNQRPAHPWVTLLRRGETLPVRVLAFRRDGFSGDIELSAEGLPQGVRVAASRVAAGQNAGMLLLHAAEDVKTWNGVIRVQGRGLLGGREISAEAAAAAVMWSVGDYNNELAASRWTDGLALGVSGVESAPVVVGPESDEPVEVTEGAKVTVPLRIVRHGEFTAELKLKAAGHPELEKLGELAVSSTSTQAVLEIPLADRKLAPGKHVFFLQCLTPGKYRNQPEALAAADAELKAAEQSLATVTAEEKPRAEAARKAAEERKKAAEERAKPRDVQVAVYSRPITLMVKAASTP